MYIIPIFSSYIFYLIIFIISYFAIESFLAWEKVRRWSRSQFVGDFIYGIIIGALTFICQLIIEAINKNFSLPLFISTMIIIVIFQNYFKALIAIVPGFIYYLFKNYINDEIYLVMSFAIAIFLVIYYLKMFLKEKYLSLAYFLALVIWFAGSMLGAYLKITPHSAELAFNRVALIYALTIFGYFIFKYVINFAYSFKILNKSSDYQFLNFFRPSAAVWGINNFLVTNKIKYGYLVLFKLNYNRNYAQYIDDKLNLNIENYFYKLVQKAMRDKGILFSYEGAESGLFIPASQADLQTNNFPPELMKITKILNSRYDWKANEIPLKLTTNFGISKYGFDSQSVNKLINYSAFALNQQPTNNQKNIFFDWEIYQSFIKDNNSINLMDKTFQLDNLLKTFTPLYDIATHANFATYTNVDNVSEFELYEKMRERIYIKNFQNEFDRYYASDFLLESYGNKVILNYAPTIFEDNFSLPRFNDFFVRNKIEYKSVYMLFDYRGLERIKNHKLVASKLAIMSNLGLNFIIPTNYPKTKSKQIIPKVKFTFVDAKKLNIFKNNYPQAKLICYSITTVRELKNAITKNVKILGGPLFRQELNFLKFPKQSKMYLESVIKERNSG